MRAATAWWLLCLALLASAGGASADGLPETRPAVAASGTEPGSLESRPIRRSAVLADPSSPAAIKPSDPLSIWRVGSALAIVLAAIFALRWGSRKMLGLPVGGGPTSAIRILGRLTISPRQQLLLVHVGRRILVVANSGTAMSNLSEITDADEVATILGQVHRPHTADEPGAFSSAFAQASTEFDQEPKPQGQEGDAALSETRAEIGGLLDKVRTLSRSFRRA